MKKTNFTFLKGLAMSALMSFSVAEASAQLNCQGQVNVSLDAACAINLTATTFSAGTAPAGALITIKNGTTILAGPSATIAQDAKAWIGKTYTFELTDASGNKCWGSVKFEDKVGPSMGACPKADVAVTCATGVPTAATLAEATTGLGYNLLLGGAAVAATPAAQVLFATDCSGISALTSSDVTSGALCTNDLKVTRTYTATDGNGMTATCVVVYNVSRPVVNAAAITYPSKANFSVCGATAALALSGSYNPGVKLTPATTVAGPNFTGVGLVAFTETGYPSFAGGSIVAGSGGEKCQVSATWTDKVAATPCGITIARTWVVIDWCTGAVIAPSPAGANVQVITLNDYTAPVITGATADITINTSVANCLSNQMVQMPAASDACSAITTSVTVGGSTFPVTAGQASIVGLPVGGPYVATWTVKDACGNTATKVQNISVKDLISPTAVADLNTKVALSQSCEAVVNAITFDDGSLDNCCLDVNSFRVKRMTAITVPAGATYTGNTTFDKTITFTKADCAGPVMVQFQVSDCNGNSNTAMVNVIVEDKIGPVAFGDQITVCCGSGPSADAWLNAYKFNELTLTNYPSATNPGWFDNCSAEVTSGANGGSINNCGVGSKTKTFTVTDKKNGMSAQATITYKSENRSAYEVEFPQDVELVCVAGTVKNQYATDPTATIGSTTVPGTPQITAYDKTCPLVGIEHTDEVFTVLPGTGENGCFKIVRTWKVLNWCQALDLNADKGATNVARKYRNISETRLGTAPDAATGLYTANVYAAGVPCADIMTAAQLAYNTKGGYDNDGYMEYTQIIKVTDNVAPTVTAGTVGVAGVGKTCEVEVLVTAPGVDDCTGAKGSRFEILNSSNVVVAFGDDKAGYGQAIKFAPTGQGNRTFGTYTVRWTGTDKCGNYASVDKVVVIADVKKPTPICYHGLSTDLMPTSGDVWVSCGLFDAGSYDNCGPVTCFIQTPAPGAGAPVPTIAATTSNATPGTMAPMASFNCVGAQTVALWVRDAAGNYDYCETYIEIQNNAGAPNPPACIKTQPAGNKVAAAVKTEAGNAANATVAIEATGFANTIKMKTLAGIAGSAYTQNGATVKVSAENDVNPLNGVSTLDLVLISKHILGTQPIASNYAQIAADVNNSGKISTADLVELRKMILGIQSNFSNNTSWKFFGANMQQLVTINNISKDETVNFTAVKIGDINGNADATLAAGRSTVNFNVADATLAAGQEVKVVMNNKEAEGFQFAMNYDAASLEVVSVDEYSAVLENGTITTAQVGTEFAVTFKAKNNVQLSKAISLGSAINGEAVVNGTSANVAINFNNATSTFELAQNQPNPFRGATVVSFSTPVEGAYTLSIVDMAGRTVQTLNGTAVKGTNNVNVEMTSAGVFNYTVKTSNFTATKKMVVIE